MATPLAYLLTWTTYGSWLPGDGRGSVDPTDNAYGTPIRPPCSELETDSARLMRGDSIFLDIPRRKIVHAAIEDHCCVRGWNLLALNVRTQHVHAVVSRIGIAPEIAIGQFKSWATRRLREAGLANTGIRVWTREGSTRYLFFEEAVSGAVRYVRDEQ